MLVQVLHQDLVVQAVPAAQVALAVAVDIKFVFEFFDRYL